MQICLYLKHFPSDGNNLQQGEGTRKAVHGLASGLAACGADVTVLCEGNQDSLVKSTEGYKIACFSNPNPEPCFTIAPTLKDYIRHQHDQSSLIILNGIFHRSVFAFSQFLKQHSIPYIAAPHDPYHPAIFQKNTHLKIPYWFLFEQRLLKSAKAIQVLDIRHQDWIRRLGVSTPVLEVPNGFSPQDVHPDSTLTWRLDGTPKLLFLGRIDSHNKGLDILLNAFAEIAKTSDAQLTIQGPDWGDRTALEKQAIQLGLSGRVEFLGPDYQLSPSALIANYDIFCISSRFEGFSLSALEAMLAGRVLLISEIAGIAPHVQASGCGLVVKAETRAIACGLQELFQYRPEWQAMGLKGRQHVLEKLNWCNIASHALGQYQNLCAKGNH
jgi:glycosyltransferase involved in cell wall biosynthesis